MWISGLPTPDSWRSLRQATYPHLRLQGTTAPNQNPALSYASPKVFASFSKKKRFLSRVIVSPALLQRTLISRPRMHAGQPCGEFWPRA